MRAGIAAGPVWIGGRVPGPKAATSTLGFLVCLPIYIVILVIQGLTVAIWLLTAALWLIIWTVKIIGYVLLGITAPIWWPIRGWLRHRRKVRDRKAVARVRNLMSQPPVGRRVA